MLPRFRSNGFRLGIGLILSILAVAAYAATVSLNARVNCNTYGPITYCYYSGTVTFTNGYHRIYYVDCYVSGVWNGNQSDGFTDLGNMQYGYAKCCTQHSQFKGSGTYQTEDVVDGKDISTTPYTDLGTVALGYANWTP